MSPLPMSPSTPLICVADGALDRHALSPAHAAWAAAQGFSGQKGKLLPLADAEGALAATLFGMGKPEEAASLVTGLAGAGLAPGRYRLEGAYGDATKAALGFRLGAYRFDRYRKGKPAPELDLPEAVDAARVQTLTQAVFLARDLVNTPANDLGPDAFEAEVRRVAAAHGMEVSAVVGEDLLAANFPMIHAVGRASTQAPRLLDLRWGRADAPKVTLVGKGVTFDTGGLNIKPGGSMALMKKDMGGAANMLGLALAIVGARLDLRLRVLLPVVENAIAGNAFRPGDVLPSRKGITVEIGNTDAEGRLILGDALALADEEAPQLLIDMATLTGAARVALGPDLPPLYSTDRALGARLVELGLDWDDPLWEMPLWPGYRQMLDSKIADISHISQGGFAGSITAALFLERFVEKAQSWAHLDIFAWAPQARATRPFGGTDQGIRAIHAYLSERYPGS